MNSTETAQANLKPKLIAVGGGKGGVGKSVVSTLLASVLARRGNRTVLVDADLGGANIHILLGIKSPPRTLNDFVTKRFASLEDVCLPTDQDNLRLICGISEVLSLANLQFAQKVKILQFLPRLSADYVVIDLGAGTTFNVLDFFLAADHQLVVLTPQPPSIQNAYAFVRNAVYRRLSRLSSQKPSLQALVKAAMNPKNELQVHTLKELFDVMQQAGASDDVQALRADIAGIRPALITNNVTNRKDREAGRIIQLVAEKYLTVQPTILGGVAYDPRIDGMVTEMTPLIRMDPSSEAFLDLAAIAERLA